MKNRLWLYQIPFVMLFTGAFYCSELAYDGQLTHKFLRTTLRRVSGTFTDFKFRLRGAEKPRNNVVIVEIDEDSIAKVGRWPWHRDRTAELIENVFAAGAKLVGLDMWFSEPDQRIPTNLAEMMSADSKFQMLLAGYETDTVLAQTIARHAEHLVLGWSADTCNPHYDATELCPVLDPRFVTQMAEERIEKFAIPEQRTATDYRADRTRMASFASMLTNMPAYNAIAQHLGFVNTDPDPDGLVRRGMLAVIGNGRVYPSLGLEVARMALGDEVSAEIGDDGLRRLGFRKSGYDLPVSATGYIENNFRGPGRTFKYVSAAGLVHAEGDTVSGGGRAPAALADHPELKDAIVLIGLSAVGVFDMRAFPFDANVPGVEGHATLVDNILARDLLARRAGPAGRVWMFLLMVVGALAFAYATERLESVPALLLFTGVFAGLGVVDVKVLFAHNVNWDTSFLYLELFTIFAVTLAAKYVLEERSKKFVKGAFAKYVAPAVVDSIMKDPTKLTVGGEKRALTIMFSDIRGFTTFSEKMDAKALSSFLNDYLGIMTAIVFKHHGTLDKYIGDAVMAFWGAPLEDARHAANCAAATREMMEALAANRARFLSQYGVDVAIGIGFNSGVVSVGNMGSPNNFSYTVIGDDVNLASRLEGLTKPYGVSILTTRFSFEAMAQAGAELPPHRVLDFVKVKGKKKAVELIQVLDRPLPEDGLRLFAEGRALYLAQRFEEAAGKFKAAQAVLGPAQGGTDGPSLEFLGRCNAFREDPPGDGWDGSWEMHSK